jgi:hypothetical protein
MVPLTPEPILRLLWPAFGSDNTLYPWLGDCYNNVL